MWFGAGFDERRAQYFGLRLTGGGTHQSKTLMYKEIFEIIQRHLDDTADIKIAVLGENLLGKSTASGRDSAYRNLSSLYGLSSMPPLTQAFLRLADSKPESLRLSALLVALCRDPLLRDSALEVMNATVGAPVQWPALAVRFGVLHPNRFSEKMLKSMSQNCASTWTQTGHLQGRSKLRTTVHPAPDSVSLAALIATVCGFSGPAILSSGWLQVLDLTSEGALDALRAAEGMGLARVRAAGDVVEIAVRAPLGSALGVPELEHV